MIFTSLPDLIGTLIGALLTIFILSYVIGDNPLFRATIYIFIGVAAGFAGAVAVRSVLIPFFISPILTIASGNVNTANLLNLVPIILSLLLLTKMFNRVTRLGNISMAYLVGIGAAVAISGAIFGTLFPQSLGAMNLLKLDTLSNTGVLGEAGEFINRIIAFVGTLATLIYFQFTAKPVPNAAPQRSQWIEWISKVGHGFIAVTFGATFAGVFAASLSALIERIQFLWHLFLSFLQ